MSDAQGPLISRRLAAFLMAGALVTLTVFAGVRTFQLRARLMEEGAEQSARQLATTMDLWESYVTDRAAGWLAEAAVAEDLARQEKRGRDSTPWLEGIYVWERGEEGVTFVHPAPPVVEAHEQLFRDPCLARAREISRVAPPAAAGAAFVRCRSRGEAVWLLASSLAAALFEAGDQPQLALRVLTEEPPPLELTLAEARERRLSLQRVVVRRTQAARLYRSLGEREPRRALLLGTVEEITGLGGAELEGLLTTAAQLVRDDLPDLASTAELARMDRRVAAAHRRLRGWREVRDRLAVRSAPETPAEPMTAEEISASLRFASDIYGDRDMLLAYGPIGNGRYAAVHLHGEPLLEGLARTSSKDGTRLAIVDAQEEVLHGELPGGDGAEGAEIVLAELPFSRVFPQLRAVLVGPVARERSLGPGWILGQLAPVLVALVLGVIAIAGRLAADSRQRDLLQRQQDFIARVTHELKTPIAGIRLMAETLEMGMISDPARRQEFLQRIDQEAQRLEVRIDDILKVARARRPGRRTLTDPMELTEEVVARWRGQFELAGATLEADLHPCPEIEVDRGLLRDALSNLVDNALKYRREDRPGRCRVRCLEDGPWVVFEVTDNGIGVPPAQRRSIFERFARIEGPGRGKSGGHGLGLSFVAEAAAAHNGLTECREGFDGGARFILKLRSAR